MTFTNNPRQASVPNMTAGEVHKAKKCNEFRVIEVWEHKPVATRIAVHVKVYQVLLEYMEPKTGADLVFTTESGEKVTDIGEWTCENNSLLYNNLKFRIGTG